MADKSRYGTPFVETEALAAVISDHGDAARDILDGLLPGELYLLANHAEVLAEMAMEQWRQRRSTTTAPYAAVPENAPPEQQEAWSAVARAVFADQDETDSETNGSAVDRD